VPATACSGDLRCMTVEKRKDPEGSFSLFSA